MSLRRRRISVTPATAESRVRGTREKVERAAARRDVRRQEFGDGVGGTARAVALESFERDVVHAFHRKERVLRVLSRDRFRCRTRLASRVRHSTFCRPAAAAASSMMAVASLEPSCGVPDADPAIAEASGAA